MNNAVSILIEDTIIKLVKSNYNNDDVFLELLSRLKVALCLSKCLVKE